MKIFSMKECKKKSINNKKSIVIFTYAHMGDFIWATSTFRIIKDYNKDIELILISSKKFVDFIDDNLVDLVISITPKYYDHKNKFIRIMYKIYWLTINYFSLKKSNSVLFLDISRFMAFATKNILKIKNIYGPSFYHFGYSIKNPDTKYYTKNISLQKDQDKMHMLIRYQTLVRSLFPSYNLALPEIPSLQFGLSIKIKNLMEKSKKYKIVLCTTGATPWRYWDLDYFKQLIIKINKEFDSTFFIVGNSKKEIKKAEYLKTSLNNVDIRNLCGKTSIADLENIMKNMDLLISIDTGIIHLAAVYRVPTICLHGGTLPEQSRPVNKNAVVLFSLRNCSPCNYEIWKTKKPCKYPKCMYDITPDMVLEEVRKILN